MPTQQELVMDYLRRHRDAVASLSGALWFSEKEWWILRDRGRDRTYAELDNGYVVEYTEMITFEMLAENPEEVCGFGDAKLLGFGKFDHWEKYQR